MDVARPSGAGALLFGLLALLGICPVASAGESIIPRPTPREIASRVDVAFHRSLPAPVEDEAFLRRVYLDLTGKVPAPEEMRHWNADRTPNKGSKLIARLLHSEAYAVNWGRYWRDVV